MPEKTEQAKMLEELSKKYSFVEAKGNTISFTLQDGPIKEKGVNGCQVDVLLSFAREVIEFFNNRFPCQENEKAIENVMQALEWLEERKKDREKRGVEGKNRRN